MIKDWGQVEGGVDGLPLIVKIFIRGSCLVHQSTLLFPETCAIAHAHAGAHASKFTHLICCKCKIIIFSLLILFYYISVRRISREEKTWWTLCMERYFVWTVRNQPSTLELQFENKYFVISVQSLTWWVPILESRQGFEFPQPNYMLLRTFSLQCKKTKKIPINFYIFEI